MKRQACKDIDDGLEGVTCWDISIAFGRDEQGEFLDVDSDHRKCGPSYHRIHEDGHITTRDEPIGSERFNSAVAGEPSSSVADKLEPIQPKSKQLHIRVFGVLLALLGLYLALISAQGESHPGQVIFFSLVLIGWGAWVAWRPEDWR